MIDVELQSNHEALPFLPHKPLLSLMISIACGSIPPQPQCTARRSGVARSGEYASTVAPLASFIKTTRRTYRKNMGVVAVMPPLHTFQGIVHV
jgi:hypothetical protein